MTVRYGYVVTFVYIIADWMCTSATTPRHYILEENCASTIAFSESMALDVSNLTSVETCNVVIQDNNINNKLLIDFTQFDLVDNCTVTKFNIVDDFGKIIAGPLCGHDLNTTVFRTRGGIAYFQYSSTSPDTLGKNMSVIITSFNMGTSSKCASFEFQCANKLCIANDLICNHYDECSDNSDETLPACTSTSTSLITNTSTSPSPSPRSSLSPTPSSSPSPSSNPKGSHTAIILGVSVPGTIVIIALIILVIWCCYKRKACKQFGVRNI